MSLIVFNASRLYSAISFVVAVSLGFFSGWNENFIDRANYVAMYDLIILNDELAIQFYYAKDVMFLVAVHIANYFSDDAKFAFFLVTTTSFLLKFFAVRKLAPEYTLKYVVAYAIFLSPGLEFAAMRSALALGFVMLALAYRERKFKFCIFSVFAIASHLSSLLVIVLALPPVSRFCVKYKLGYAIIFIAAFLLANTMIKLYPYGVDYLDNKGTVFAFSLPLSTLVITFFVFFRTDRFPRLVNDKWIFNDFQVLRSVTYGLVAVGFGLAPTIVTATTRYLEFSWGLLLLTSLISSKKKYINMVGLMLLIAFLSYLNISRGTWLSIINQNIV